MSLIAVSGSSGFIGSALIQDLTAKGNTVLPIVRAPEKTGVFWDWERQKFHYEQLEGTSTVIHLAGHPVAQKWTPEIKNKILNSRVQGTKVLVEGLGKMKKPPKTLITVSAIGFYGDRGQEILTESSKTGKGFLASVASQWEAEAQKAEQWGIRVVMLRLGVVLSFHGGALKLMLTPFQVGMPLLKPSYGHQWVSWVTLQDVLRTIHHVIENESFSGCFNVVSPNPCTNNTFIEVLSQVMQRSITLPPAMVLKMMFGELAQELMLASTRCVPQRLIKEQFSFQDTDLKMALKNMGPPPR